MTATTRKEKPVTLQSTLFKVDGSRAGQLSMQVKQHDACCMQYTIPFGVSPSVGVFNTLSICWVKTGRKEDEK